MGNANEDINQKSYSSDIQRVLVVGNNNLAEIKKWTEGVTLTLGSGYNDSSFILSKGTTNQYLNRVKVTVPGGIGNITVQFYDGAIGAATAMTGSMYCAAEPDEGFDVTGLKLTSGSLFYRINGWTSGNSQAFLNVKYNLPA